MVEGRTSAFEQYLKDQKNAVNSPKKGRPARVGKLEETSDELSEKNEEEEIKDIDIAV